MNKLLFAIFVTGLAFTFFMAVSGCSTVSPTLKPCITSVPVKRKIVTLRKPSPVPWSDDEGEHLGLDIVVDPDSMLGFFQYVAEMEEALGKASKCVER